MREITVKRERNVRLVQTYILTVADDFEVPDLRAYPDPEFDDIVLDGDIESEDWADLDEDDLTVEVVKIQPVRDAATEA